MGATEVFPDQALSRSFYVRDTKTVAGVLLGKVLAPRRPDGVRAGRIVEVEAHLGAQDAASHSYQGLTPAPG